MNLLLDTHILLWVLLEPQKLDKRIKHFLEQPESNVYISNLCLWEISLKYGSGKLKLDRIVPDDILSFTKEAGFVIKNINEKEATTFYQLTGNYHKDPFDRMMIWQAICNNFTFVTDDKQVRKYVPEGLKVL
jgi:PIN domain nuclease of toxin-antitoxin system